VALVATFRGLAVSLDHLHQGLNELHVMAGDKPEHDEAAVADDIGDSSLELLGALHEARRAAEAANRAVASRPHLDQARRALSLCQERFHRIEKEFSTRLASFEKLKEVVRLGNERRPWAPWANMVKQAIEQIRPLLEQTSQALAACWQELAERLGMMNISVQTTSIGQQNNGSVGIEAVESEGVT
jgi:hypothetical protein